MELNYKEFGQGEPIIILHGLFGTLDNWQTIAKHLAEDNSVYLLDQRNHGRSPHSDDFDYEIMAEDLHEFMENNWMYNATIIGHSMGGKVAMQFAMQYPDMVKQMIIVDIAPKAYEGGHQTIFDALLALDLDAISSRKEADAFLEARISDFGVRQFLLKNLSRDKSGQYYWKMNLPVIYRQYQAILGTIKGENTSEVESLFIRGGRSQYIQDKDLPLIQNFFPNSTLKTIDKAGHWVHAEAPKALLTLVRDFMTT